MPRIVVIELTPEAFAPFGETGERLADGGHGMGDVALDLSAGMPRFYIMRLSERGPAFQMMARHVRRRLSRFDDGRNPRSGRAHAAR
jgi:hypothetical protein